MAAGVVSYMLLLLKRTILCDMNLGIEIGGQNYTSES